VRSESPLRTINSRYLFRITGCAHNAHGLYLFYAGFPEERKEHTMFKDTAIIHSRKGTDTPTDTVTIIEHKDNNNVIAEYKGQRCTAIFNPFVGMYYVDDVYGKLEGG
jgi:hypothetical protein